MRGTAHSDLGTVRAMHDEGENAGETAERRDETHKPAVRRKRDV